MTTTYVASVSPFTATARDDRSPVARVRYVSDGAIYVKVADVSHDALPSVTGYPIEFWLRIDHLARQAHHYLADLIAARKIAQVTTFEELPPPSWRASAHPARSPSSALSRRPTSNYASPTYSASAEAERHAHPDDPPGLGR